METLRSVPIRFQVYGVEKTRRMVVALDSNGRWLGSLKLEAKRNG